MDPLAKKYSFQSPYAFENKNLFFIPSDKQPEFSSKRRKFSLLLTIRDATNNPVHLVDVNGLGVGEKEWKPIISLDGSTKYKAEKGDSAATLAKQYNISQTQAEQITGTNGNEEVKEGTEISGVRVKYITGSEVLRLNLSTANDQQVFDQFNFAMVHSKMSGRIGFFTTDYFSKVFDQSLQVRGVAISVGHIKFKFELHLYETQNTFSFHPKYYPYFISNSPFETVSSNKGNMFGKLEYIKQHRYDIYLTFGKQPTGNNLKYQGYLPVFYKTPELDNNLKNKKIIKR